MAGASIGIDIEVSDRAVRRGFRRLEGVMRNTTPVMAAIGTGLVGSTLRRFISQTAPDGAAWAPLNPEYAAGKRNSRILTESGGLSGSITSAPSRDTVEVGTNKIYAAPHQFGAVIRPKSATHLIFTIGGRTVGAKSVTIPERPFLGLSAEDETMIAEVVFGFVERKSRR